MIYTTEDELAAIRRMYYEGRIAQLRVYRKALAYRHWDGADVDVEAVRKELDRLLGPITSAERQADYVNMADRLRRRQDVLSIGA